MRLLTKSYGNPRRKWKRTDQELIHYAPSITQRWLLNIERDQRVFEMRKRGVPLRKVAANFSMSTRLVRLIEVRYQQQKAACDAYLTAERSRKPVERQRITPTYYFNACPKCKTGTMLAQFKCDVGANEMDCLNCGMTVSAPPLKRARVENWDYETANRRHYGS